jgi:hypothetical protein
MARLDEAFITEDMPKGNDYSVLPAGWYVANIASAEETRTKNGKGKYLKIRYNIAGPTHQGRVVFGNLNTHNDSEKAQEVGRRDLGDLLRALGIAKLTDTDQLVGGNVEIKLAVKEAEGQYEAQNDVKGFKSASGSAPMPKASSANKAAEPSANGKAPPPWAKKG